MRVAEYVAGELLILEVTSRSRGREIVHYLGLELKEDGQVAAVSCSCEGFGYRGACHHLRSLRDMAGAPAHVELPTYDAPGKTRGGGTQDPEKELTEVKPWE